MQPRFRRHEAMFAAGLSARTSNEAEMDPDRARIPALWRKFHQDALIESTAQRVTNSAPLGVYLDYENGAEGDYTVVAAVEVSDLSRVAEPLFGVVIDAGDYIVFTGEGAMPEAVIAAWRHVWEFFARPRCDELRRSFTVDFERHVNDNTVEIWIAVETGG
ncbi:MAG: GyrI-like domain-containing protein [Pirellulaceae bacterium]